MDVVKGAEEKQNFSYLLVKRDYEAGSMGLSWRDNTVNSSTGCGLAALPNRRRGGRLLMKSHIMI